MDDQQENVFDVTARARQWRRSRPPAPSGKDAEGPRSDAPKSIAGSLLVPAEMLAGSLPADQPAAENEQAALPRGTATAVDGTSAAERSRQNPFLVPPAESAVASLEVRPLAGDHRGARATGRVDAHAPRLSSAVGAAHDRSPPRGCPALGARVRVGGLRRRDPDHGGDRQPIRHSPPGVRTQRARGWAPRRAGDGRSLRVEQPACATGSAARPSTPPRATNPCAPDNTRASTTASGDQACRSRSPVHAVHVKHSLLHPQLDELKLRGLGLHAGVLAVRAREAPRRAARARAAAARRLVKTESSAPAGAPPTLSKETPVQCSRP